LKIFIKKILEILSKKDKKKIILSVIFLLTRSVLEVVSIGLLVPILNFISNENKVIFLYNYFPFLQKLNNKESIIFFISIFIFIYLIKTVFTIFYNSWNAKFVNNLSTDLAYRVVSKYLDKSYIFFLENNSASLVRNISSETSIFAQGLIGHIILSIAQIIFIISICLFLIFYNVYSVYVILILILLSSFIIYFSNKKFKNWGIVRQEESTFFLKKINEIIGNIKEIILYDKKFFFSNELYLHSKSFSNANIYRDTVISYTSPIIEFIGVLIFFIFLLFLIIYSSLNFGEIVVLFGVFVFASLKLLPAVISLVRSAQSIKFNLPACEVIYQILKNSNDFNNLQEFAKEFKENKNINLTSMEFKNVSFIYNSEKSPILNHLNFQINKGDKVALIGETGSGKTTLLNLISTLIIPSSGEIVINNFDKINSFKEIRKRIGYVSQFVYLSDNSVLFNIALTNDITEDQKKIIMQIIKNLNLNIINNRPIDVFSSIGERGSKLSGGQMQRIGIARALYRNPDILILDESTNALDEENEEEILKFLVKEFDTKIIIFCTHKKEILKYCNKILEVKNGAVKIK
jgi:ABC-type multidrug transport system fused ATPase/permease subunit